MCGIIGIFGEKNAFDKLLLGLNILKNRGKDGFGIYDGKRIEYKKRLNTFSKSKEKNILGHVLHSIVEYVPQPIKKKGILVANCEIYNWQELKEKYKFNSKNDAELLLDLLDKFGTKKIEEMNGVYAFAYWDKDKLILARDILGEKPLWYVQNNKAFAFASEKKALREIGYENIQELNPRQILIYDSKKNKINFQQREFFIYLPEWIEDYSILKEKTKELLNQAMLRRIPQRKFGVLFSGGLDSVYIAYWLKKHNYNFTCYTAALDTDKTQPSDLTYALKIAKELGLNIKVKKVKVQEIHNYLKKVVPLIEDSHVVKASVALTFYLACELAEEDGCKVIFSGLGSEEIFAGYERHKLSSSLNSECVSGLLKMYERDLYRDDVITMHHGLELRTPFLDSDLIKYALRIPDKYKIKNNLSKYILREIALEQGLPEEYAMRKKVAAQYGSRMDYGLERAARLQGFSSKSPYLKTFYSLPNVKLGVLFSSGKDSTYAAYLMQRQNYELTCLITIKSENKESYMFHTPAIELSKLQAKAMELPLLMIKTHGEKEVELKDLERALSLAKKKYHIEGVVSGAIFSTYQRDRVEKVCDKLGLKIFSPLWHKPQEMEMYELLGAGFKFIFTAVAAEGLDASWLGREITKKDVDLLKKLNERLGTNIAGEGGEFESLVLDCPLFKKRLVIQDAEVVKEGSLAARLVIRKAKLVGK